MRDEHTHFTEEALKAQDGKKVPLTLEVGGRIIGETTLKYDDETGDLMGEFRIDDPVVAKYLRDLPPAIVFRKDG